MPNFLGFGETAHVAIERSGSHPNRIRDRPLVAQSGRLYANGISCR